MSVSVSIVDCVYGRPAVGMAIRLIRDADGVLTQQWRLRTDDDGHISGPADTPLPHGTYELELDIEGYFTTLGFMSLNSAITVRFHLPGGNYHYCLAALVSPSACIVFKES